MRQYSSLNLGARNRKFSQERNEIWFRKELSSLSGDLVSHKQADGREVDLTKLRPRMRKVKVVKNFNQELLEKSYGFGSIKSTSETLNYCVQSGDIIKTEIINL